MEDNGFDGKAGLCPQCKDKGFVLKDVDYGHPDFAKLIPCTRSAGAPKPTGRRRSGPVFGDDVSDIGAVQRPFDALAVG